MKADVKNPPPSKGRARGGIAVRKWLATRLFANLALLGLTLLATTPPAFAQSAVDRVHRRNGLDSGKITAITPLGVTIAKSGVDSTIPVEDIENVQFAGEPAELVTARNAIKAGRPQEAVEALSKLSTSGIPRDEIIAEVEFYVLLAKSELALAGQAAPDATAAEVRSFMARRNKSYHIPQALELLGDLLTAAGQYGSARNEYAKLAKAKSKYFEMKSALLVGRAWQAEGDHAKALAEFDAALASTERGPAVEPIRLAATLDRAVSQAAIGKVDESAAAIGEIIKKANPEDGELLSRAYNALGDCYLKSGDSRGALYSFLHVDLLYNQEAEAHAKALHELSELWKAVGRDTRAQEAMQELSEKYPNSRWAKR
jgi:tetratricopeptide (TPR) repeat protein